MSAGERLEPCSLVASPAGAARARVPAPSVHGPAVPPADAALARVEWQRVIFAERPGRLDLLRLRPAWALRDVRIRVHRNQPFEFVASAATAFLGYAGFRPSYAFGPYDDALAALGDPGPEPFDVEIVWLDFARYLRRGPEEIAAWLATRIAALRGVSSAPILVADAAGPAAADGPTAGALNVAVRQALDGLPGVHVVGQSEVARDLGAVYVDMRSPAFAATALSDTAAIETARRFGLEWIPAVLAPRLKAVVVDLDNTLYAGVLGEDGPAGVRVDEAHLGLQRRLRELAASGLFLAVASRNDPADVEALFAARPDFELRRADFSAVAASWQPKARSIAATADALHIAPDAVLFVDDNPGELAQVASELPGVWPLHAADPAQARLGLCRHPGLLTFHVGREDALRAADVASEATRARLAAEAVDPVTYLRSLDVHLTFALDPESELVRIHELSAKTNQFNTGFLRLSEADVARRLADRASFLVTVALRDRLTDSGIVGLVAGRRTGPDTCPSLLVEEVAISCRALGRGVEDLIVGEAIRGAVSHLGLVDSSALMFRWRSGPRNSPARDWLDRFGQTPAEDGSVGVARERLDEAQARLVPLVTIKWEGLRP